MSQYKTGCNVKRQNYDSALKVEMQRLKPVICTGVTSLPTGVLSCFAFWVAQICFFSAYPGIFYKY